MRKNIYLFVGIILYLLVTSCEKQNTTPKPPIDDVDTSQVADFKLVEPMLDINFTSDGGAIDKSRNSYRITSSQGYSSLVWKHPSYDGYIARFMNQAGSNAEEDYYFFNYYGYTKFLSALKDGFSMECTCMYLGDDDGSNEVKAFSSTEGGGAAIMISNNNIGRELCFLVNVGGASGGNWVWAKSGILPEKGRYYNVIGVWDKEQGRAKIYVDGVLKNSAPTSGEFNPPKQSCYKFMVGADPKPSGVESVWQGDIVRACVYDEVLDGEYIAQYYKNNAIMLPDAKFKPSKLLYMNQLQCNNNAKFKVIGKGFIANDKVFLQKEDSDEQIFLDSVVDDGGIQVSLREDVVSGVYKIFASRDNEHFPLGKIKITITDEQITLVAPKIVAHRGFHKNGIPENSIAAVVATQQRGYYGAEIDVWLTSDGIVVCNHDGYVGGKNIQTSTYQDISTIKLSNGEVTPLFTDLMTQIGKDANCKLILEFKTQSSTDRNNTLVDKCLEIISDAGLDNMVEYIAFDYDVCKRVAQKKPNAIVGYLNGDKSPSQLHNDGIMCMDYNYGKLNQNLVMIKEAHDLDMLVNVWTVNSDNDLMFWLNKNVDYITTDNPDRLKELIEAFFPN